MKNIYENCPVYETSSLILRLVRLEDAEDLLGCYSDLSAVARMNSDACTNNFYYPTIEKMREAITFWLAEYENKYYIRFAIINKMKNKAVGTVELFSKEFPVIGNSALLRLDICSKYETAKNIFEIITLVVEKTLTDFNTKSVLVKVGHTPESAKVFTSYGFVPTEDFRPGLGYYIYKNKGIAYCGLACCVCSENDKCAGCQSGGCDIHGWCKNYNCCREKGLGGCWECVDFPCAGSMLDKPRIRAFARFAKEFGTDELTKCLIRNKENGILYHYDGQLVGDYDKCETEEKIIEMIKGKQND